MAGNDFSVRRNHAEHLFHSSNHAAHAAAVPRIHERKPVSDEIVAHMHHVCMNEENDTVAIGVAVWKVDRANLFIIDMDGSAIVESDYWQRGLGRGFHF